MKTNGRTDERRVLHVAVSVRIAARSLLINMQDCGKFRLPTTSVFSASALIIHPSILSQLFREAAVYSCIIPFPPPSLTRRWPSRGRRAGRRDRRRQSGTGAGRWSWRGQKCRNVINNRQGKIYKLGIDDKREARKLWSREHKKTEMQDCRVGGGRGNGEKRRLIENKKITLSSSEGLNSFAESGCANLVLPQSASLQTICVFEPFMEEQRPIRLEWQVANELRLSACLTFSLTLFSSVSQQWRWTGKRERERERRRREEREM